MSVSHHCRSLPRLLQRHNAPRLLARAHSITFRGLTTHASSTPLGVSSSSSTFSTPAVDQNKLRHLKHPSRGGQDLSKRYQRLERSIRGKTSYGRGIEAFERSRGVTHPAPYTTEENIQGASTTTGKINRRIYRGFVVPEAPKPPADDGTSHFSLPFECVLIPFLNQNVACLAALSACTTCTTRPVPTTYKPWTSSALT